MNGWINAYNADYRVHAQMIMPCSGIQMNSLRYSVTDTESQFVLWSKRSFLLTHPKLNSFISILHIYTKFHHCDETPCAPLTSSGSYAEQTYR